MKSLQINGQTYAFKIHQKNDDFPYLIMLHGFMGDHRAFSHLKEPLKSCCNPVTIDLLGHGKSSSCTEWRRYQEKYQLQDLCAFCNELNFTQTMLYGYSMGGRLALKLALAYPDLFEGLILESANAGMKNVEKRAERRRQDEERAQYIETNYGQFLNDWQKLDLFQSPAPADESLQEKYRQMQSQQTPAAMAASLRGFGTGMMEPAYKELANFKHPVLLLAGSADEKYQGINRLLADHFPHAIFSSITAGHRVHLDNPKGLIRGLCNTITYFDYAPLRSI